MKAHDYDMQVVREATHFVAFMQITSQRMRMDFHTYGEALACVKEWEAQSTASRKGIVYAVNAAGRQVCVDPKMAKEAGLS